MPQESRSALSKTVSHLIAFSHNEFLSKLSVGCGTSELILWSHLPAGLEELWFGINFDPLEGTLSWEPSCPVTAVVRLCQKREDSVCVDLPHASQNVSREKVHVSDMLKQQLCLLCKVSGYLLWSQITWRYRHTRHESIDWIEMIWERG